MSEPYSLSGMLMDRKCTECDGRGTIWDGPPETRYEHGSIIYGQRPRCNKCYGSGWELTDDGKKLLAFLARHFDTAANGLLPIVEPA